MTDRAPQTALEKAHSAFIHYPRLDDLNKKVRRCQRISKISLEPQCLALEGASGAGKTTFVRDLYAAHFPPIETPEGTIIPVLYAEIPSPATVKTGVSTLLEALGDPAAHSGTVGVLNSRLVGLIKECHVELVILDEFNNLIDTETDRVLAKVSDWLKMLIKKTRIPFVVVGLEGKVERILRANVQLSRLFASREKLEPFKWDLAAPGTIDAFNIFINTAEKQIGRPLPRTISRADLLYRLFYATDGVVGYVMILLRYAVELADEQHCSSIEMSVLAQAFDERLAKHLNKASNPFAAPTDMRFAAPPPSANGDHDTGKTSRRRGGRKGEGVGELSAK